MQVRLGEHRAPPGTQHAPGGLDPAGGLRDGAMERDFQFQGRSCWPAATTVWAA
jgi:hypothetical protein